MKHLKDENGYALLISFVFILLLVIFVTSFSISSANHYKQVEQTDDSYELTSIAEMGVEYYLAALTNKIAMYQDPTTSEGQYLQNEIIEINDYIKSQNAIKQPPSQSVIDNHINGAMNTLISDVEEILEITCNHESLSENQLKSNPICVKEPNGANFEILKSVKDNDRTWTISVVGKLSSTNKTKVIDATYNIPSEFSLITLGQKGASGSTGSTNSPSINISFNSLFDKQTPTSNFVVNLKSNNFQNNNYSGILEKTDSSKTAEINAIGDISVSANGVNDVKILAGGKVTFNNATDYKSLKLYSKTVEFKDNINDSLRNSLIEIEDSAKFNKKLPMNYSTLQINNKIKSTNLIASFDEVELSNNSIIKANGATIFDKVNYIDNSKILINGPLTISNFINNITNNSELTVNGNTNLGSSISSINNSKVTINGNAKIGYFQGFNNNPTMDIKGVLTLTNGNKSTLSTGTVIVDSIAYSDGAVNSDESIEINGNGKLCIRDNTKLDILFGSKKKVKATSNGAIYVLDTSKDPNHEEMLKLNSNTTGSHDKLVGQNRFNELCGDGGTSTPINSDKYIMNDNQLTETDVKKDIIYK